MKSSKNYSWYIFFAKIRVVKDFGTTGASKRRVSREEASNNLTLLNVGVYCLERLLNPKEWREFWWGWGVIITKLDVYKADN